MERKTILIADDYESILDMWKIFFKSRLLDYKKEYFSDGNKLDERLKKGPKGLAAVITDRVMPGMFGTEIIKEYCGNPDYENVIFFLVHAGESEEEAHIIGKQAVKDGAKAYFVKPCGISKIIDKLKEYLEK